MPAPKDPEAKVLWKQRMSEIRLKLWENPEYRELQVSKMVGRPKTPEHRAAIGAAHVGLTHTPETKALLSEINTGKFPNEATRKKMGDAHRGKKRSPEHNALMSKAIEAYWANLSTEERQERNAYVSDMVKTKWETYSDQEKSERMRALAICSQKFWGNLSEEEKATIYKNIGVKSSVSNKAYWESMDPQLKLARIFNMLSKSGKHPNGAETRLLAKLDGWLPGKYKYVGDGSTLIGGKNPDFIYGTHLIELFGEYWHQEGDEGPRIDHFQQYGFQTLVIWERELKDPDLMNRVIVFTGAILPT